MLVHRNMQQGARGPHARPRRSNHVARVARPKLTVNSPRPRAKADLNDMLDRIDDLKLHIDELESELAEASRVAEAAAKRSRRLGERTQQLQSYAVQHVYEGDEGPARAALQQKAAAAEALAKANDRARLNCLLAAKLEQVIQLKEQELIDLVRAAKKALEAQEAAMPATSTPAAPAGTDTAVASTLAAEASAAADRQLQRSSSSSSSSRVWSSPTLHTMGSLDAGEGGLDEQLIDIQWLAIDNPATPQGINSSSSSPAAASASSLANQAADMDTGSSSSISRGSGSSAVCQDGPAPATGARTNELAEAAQKAGPHTKAPGPRLKAVLCWDGFKQVGSTTGSGQGAAAAAVSAGGEPKPMMGQGFGRGDEGAAAETAGLSDDLQRVESLVARLDGSGYQLEDDGELNAVLLRLQQQLRPAA